MQLSTQVLRLLKKDAGRGFKIADIAGKMKSPVDERELRRVIKKLQAEGRISRRNERYFYNLKRERYRGVFRAGNRGYGFVSTADDVDLFVPAPKVRGAMHGDEVIARPLRRRGPSGKTVAEIVKVVKRANKLIIGRYQREYRFGTVQPANKRLTQQVIIPPRLNMDASTGDIVQVEVDIWPEGRRPAQGRVIKIVGNEKEPGVDIDTIVLSHDLPCEFPPRAKKRAAEFKVAVNGSEVNGRLDLRDLFTVTIDGVDAKDFDDAVSLRVDGRGFFHLWVHIADVSHYVKYSDPLDKEARRRGNSVYLPDRVIPMLPEELSNDICSLKPRVERLAFSVYMKVNSQGEVVNRRLAETVIKSNHRLTYEAVDSYLEENDFPDKELADLLKSLNVLSHILMEKRIARGSLEFETIEPKIILNDKLWPVDVKIRRRTPATQIIEEAMILANETVAEYMFKARVPMIYRIHERPDPEALITIGELIKELGYPIKSLTGAHPRAFQALIDFSRRRPEGLLINMLLLRAMQQARYSADYQSHFGLASEHYTHFTSPIRRYADLTVHRLLKAKLRKRRDDKTISRLTAELEAIAAHCSTTERTAVDAEREAVDLKMCQFMLKEVGGTFTGIVSGVSSFGVFVQLENSAEGLIHISNLKDDHYRFKAERLTLIGERTGRAFSLGQRLRVKLVNVSVPKREIDFLPLADEPRLTQRSNSSSKYPA